MTEQAQPPVDPLTPVQEDPAARGKMAQIIVALGLPFSMFFVLSMAVLLFEVVMRYVFNSPTLWVHETTVFLCAIGFMFGGLYCTAKDTHIRIVIIYDAVGPKARRLLDIVIYTVCYTVCALASASFAYAAWTMAERASFTPSGSFRLETSGTAWNPPTPALLKLFLLLVLILITVQCVVLAYRAVIRKV